MSLIQTFKAAGAQSVAGSIILNRQTVAILRRNQVILTPEGEEALKKIRAKAAIEDAQIKHVEAAPAETIVSSESPAPASPAAGRKRGGVKAPKDAAPVQPDPAPSIPDGSTILSTSVEDLPSVEDLLNDDK